MSLRTEWLSLVGIVLMAAACGGDSAPEGEADAPQTPVAETPAPSGADLSASEWRLVVIDMMDGEDMTPLEGAEPRVIFSAEATPTGSRGLSGTTGCNQLTGAYDAGRGGRITVADGMAMTRRACPDERMRLESVFVLGLESATRYTIDSVLTLEFGGGVLVFEAVSEEGGGA